MGIPLHLYQIIYHTVHNTVQYSTVQYSTVQYSTQCNTVVLHVTDHEEELMPSAKYNLTMDKAKSLIFSLFAIILS